MNYKAYVIELHLRKPKTFIIVSNTPSGAMAVLEKLHPGKEVLSIKTGEFVDYKKLKIIDLPESTTDDLARFIDGKGIKALSVINRAVKAYVNNPNNAT